MDGHAHRLPHGHHTALCRGRTRPRPAPTARPLSLPQRLLLHSGHDLRLHVHVQVELQGEALLARVLRGHGSRLLRPCPPPPPTPGSRMGTPAGQGAQGPASPALPQAGRRVPPAGGRSSWSASHPAKVGSAGLQGRVAGQGGNAGTQRAPPPVLELRAGRPSLGRGQERAWERRRLSSPSASPGLLTSVCLLLAFFLESFRPVLFRSLQGSQGGQRLETLWLPTRVCCEWAVAGSPHLSHPR